jgi:hypothetical protein
VDCRHRAVRADFRWYILDGRDGWDMVEGESMRVVLKIPCDSAKLIEIMKVERALQKVGVEFDTGYDFTRNIREWELNDIKGATVEVRA